MARENFKPRLSGHLPKVVFADPSSKPHRWPSSRTNRTRKSGRAGLPPRPLSSSRMEPLWNRSRECPLWYCGETELPFSLSPRERAGVRGKGHPATSPHPPVQVFTLLLKESSAPESAADSPSPSTCQWREVISVLEGPRKLAGGKPATRARPPDTLIGE
jgi:hypothetical protein